MNLSVVGVRRAYENAVNVIDVSKTFNTVTKAYDSALGVTEYTKNLLTLIVLEIMVDMMKDHL